MLRTRHQLLALALAAALLAGCGDDAKLDEIGRNAKATWRAIAAYSAERKDEAAAYFGERMTDLAGQFEKAKAKGAELSAEGRAALDARWALVQEKYAATRDATGEAWTKARDAFAAAYRAFREELARSGS